MVKRQKKPKEKDFAVCKKRLRGNENVMLCILYGRFYAQSERQNHWSEIQESWGNTRPSAMREAAIVIFFILFSLESWL